MKIRRDDFTVFVICCLTVEANSWFDEVICGRRNARHDYLLPFSTSG